VPVELRQLRALLAVWETGGFSAAAEALDTVQSNVSSHISKLENELGVTLIDRRSGALTDEGLVVARRARRVLEELEETYSDLEGMRADITGRVRLGVIATTAGWLLPLALTELANRHPRLALEIAEGTSASLQRRLHTGNIDLALVTTPLTVSGLAFEPLFEERYVLVVPNDHPLAERSVVSLYDALEYPMIVPPKHIAFREELEAIAASRSRALKITAEIDGLHVIGALALGGFAAAILPSSARTGEPSRTVSIPVSDLSPRRVGIGRYRSRLQSAAQKALSETLVTALLDHPGSLPEGVRLAVRRRPPRH